MTPEKDAIPYGTYGRLRGVVDQFAEATTPTSLNKHVLDGLSGGDFSALMTALKFFGLINENQSVKDEFRALVEERKKGESQYTAAFLKIVKAAYEPIVGKVDVTHGTLPELEKAFKDAGVPQGQMVTKAIRFYIKALEDCGVKVSDYITKPRPRKERPKGTKTPKKGKESSADDGGKGGAGSGIPKDSIPEAYARLPIPGLGDAFIQYPLDLTVSNCDLIDAMLLGLRAYAKSRAGTEGRKK